MLFLNIILVTLICVVIHYLISYYRRRLPLVKAANALPGPKTLPFIGNALYFLQCDMDELLQKIDMLTDIYPSPFRLWLGNILFIAITDPDHAKIVLQSRSCLDKSSLYKFTEPIGGKGLFTAPASTWTIRRKMITPNFSTNTLKNFLNAFVTQSLKLADELAKVGLNGNEIELLYYIHKCTLLTIFDNAMDMKLESHSDKMQYIAAVTRLKKILMHRGRNLLLYSDTIFNLTTLGREQQKNMTLINSIAHEIMQQKTCCVNKLDSNRNKDGITPREKFIDIIIGAFRNGYGGKRLKQIEVIDEIKTMLMAGSDTTSITMNFVIFMLANFPEIQEKVYQELLKIYGTKNPKSAPIKYEDLQHMNYLDLVIKETMRVFPIAPIIGRYLTEDLKLGQYILPKGAEIIVATLALHRDKRYWPNPLIFDPDRFLPENIENRHPFCYIPFSAGPRNCIGTRYGMMSLKVMIATLVRTFVFRVDKSVAIDEIKLNMTFEIDTVEPLKVKIEKRNF